MDFLDLSISIDSQKKLQTDIYRVLAKIAVYIHWKSGHHNSTKRSVIKSTCIRFRRICSSDVKYEKACADLKKTLVGRGYPAQLITEIIKEVRSLDRLDLLKRKDNSDNNNNWTPRVSIIYAPQTVNKLRTIIKNHWNQISNLFTGHVTFALMNGTSIGEVLMKGHSVSKKLSYSPATSTTVPFNINSFHSPKERTCHKRDVKLAM